MDDSKAVLKDAENKAASSVDEYRHALREANESGKRRPSKEMKQRVKVACDTRDKARVAYGNALKASLGLTSHNMATINIDSDVARLEETCKKYTDLMTLLDLDSDMAQERTLKYNTNLQHKLHVAVESVNEWKRKHANQKKCVASDAAMEAYISCGRHRFSYLADNYARGKSKKGKDKGKGPAKRPQHVARDGDAGATPESKKSFTAMCNDEETKLQSAIAAFVSEVRQPWHERSITCNRQ